MKNFLSMFLLFLLAACSGTSNPEKTYLRNAASGEIVICEQNSMDNFFDAVGICERRLKSKGFEIIEVTKFNHYGYPIEYTVEKDPFWPDN